MYCGWRNAYETPILFDTPYNLPEIGHKPFSVAYNGVQAEKLLERLCSYMWITHSRWLDNNIHGYVSFCTHQHPLVGSFLHTLYHAKNMSSWSAWCDGRIERINIGERIVCYSMSTSTTQLHFDAAQAIASLTDIWWMLHNARSKRGFPWQWPSLLRLEQLQCLPLTMTFTTSKHAPTPLSCQNIGLFPM